MTVYTSRAPLRTVAGLLGLLMMVAAGLYAGRAVALDTRNNFDHLTTGFELVGQHRDLPCESCHANAVFKGTSPECAACHGVGTAIRATAKPANHILTTDQCGSCHTPVGWSPAVNFDHSQTRGSCSTCHNGVQAQGKPPNHLVTDLECDTCHNTLTWAGAIFSHQGISSGCAGCHNNVQAPGMPSNHIPVGAVPCEGCHSTTNFTSWAGTKINHRAVTQNTCASCHETAAYLGMHASTSTTAGDSRPPAALDANHPRTGDCGQCHDTTSFGASALRPANHIPTSAPCAQCHTTPGDYPLYSVMGTHQGVTGCLSCHGAGVGPFANVAPVQAPGNHFPFGSLDCNGSGCHTTANVNPGGFHLGTASITSPTLSIPGHTTVAGAVSACATCHEAAPYLGMVASSSGTPGDSRPPAALDPSHPTTGDCGSCHTTAPTFAGNITTATKPANHVPTSAPCAQCHTTSGNYALYSITGTHQGVTACLSCHGPAVGPFANVSIVTTPGNHIPIGSLDCNGSGCHTLTNVNPGGFKLGVANVNAPTLTVAGHATVAAAVASCQTCHQSATYLGMLAASGATAGDARPTAALDPLHPTGGDCGGCHTTTPTFGTNITASAKPSNHIPTAAPCGQCHTSANNYAQYSVSGTHQGVTACLACHAAAVAGTFDISVVTTPANHIPIGTLDCNGSGCHTIGNVNPGGFKLGTANINSPTLTAAGHTTVSAGVALCATCHETAPYLGMLGSTATVAGDSRPTLLDKNHPTAGDCGNCHVTVPVFATNLLPTAPKPANHIPTTAVCAQCHTTAGNFALYSVTGVHQGVTACLSCHGPTVGPFVNVTIVTTPGNHIPIGTLDCNGSGCHTVANVNPGGFKLGSPSITAPTLNVPGHVTVAAAVAGCQGCHETAPYLGMLVSTPTGAGDSRPTSLDKSHPTTGDCNGCHTTTPTFASDQTGGSTKPTNHIPTNAPCAQCHTTSGNYSIYSVTGTHQGVTACLACHASAVATTFANVTITSTPSNHIPIGALDCNGSGCHTLGNLSPGGFKIGSASINTPTLTVSGHTTVSAAVTACQTCHETAPYVGMVASTATAAGDSRPTALDKSHPTTGDCGGCHTTAPVFASDQTGNAKPANHIPTTAACTQCHTTAGNYTAYSVTGVHQGVSACLSCHAPAVATTFANVTIVTTPSTHIPIGSLDCNGSGCHTVANVNPGGFKLGTANLTTPTLKVAGHTTVATAVSGCQTCHEAAPYLGMIASTAGAAGDSRPTAFDKNHPTTGDCNGCHTTTPTFTSNVTSGSKPTNHIPTSAPCTQCHTTAGNYAAYVMGATGHAGITSNCAQCHAYGLSFYNMAPPTLKEPASGATGHIPAIAPNGTGAFACESCHSPTTFTSFAGTVMKHAVVTSMKCESCHEYGMKWQTNAGVQLWTRPSTNHHAGQDCGGSGCHTARDKLVVGRPAPRTAPKTNLTAGTPPRATVPAPTAAAAGVSTGAAHPDGMSGTCSGCHVPPAGHLATTSSCQGCHGLSAWLPARVEHLQVRGGCVTCHNSRTLAGKTSRHLASTDACATCHTTNAWAPARVEHTQLTGHASCAGCHDGLHATGTPRMHVQTAQSCDTCHGTLAWLPVRVDHSHLTQACRTCHGTLTAGLSTHLRTNLDCAACHAYPDWSLVHFIHTASTYPAGHRNSLECSSCHTRLDSQVTYRSPANAGSCAGCHAENFRPEAHPEVTRGGNYSATQLADCSGTCHIYGDAAHTRVVRSMPGPYHKASDASFRH